MSISPQVNVSRCSQCQRDTEYHCLTCGHHLCPPCKRSHVISLDTKHHDVMLYRGTFNSFSKSETCVTHPDQVYEMYCELCDLPVCFHCKAHQQHKLQNVRNTYKHKLQQTKDIIINIRSETLYKAPFFRTVVKNDVTTCRREIAHIQSAMLRKSQKLNDSMDPVLSKISVKFNCLLIEKIGVQKMKMRRYLNRIQLYEHRHEQLAYRPVEFLRFIKNTRLPRILNTPHLIQHCWLSLTEKINTGDLIELLSELRITEGGKRKLQAGNELLLTLLPSPDLQRSTTVEGIDYCYHISFVKPDRAWIREYNKLILTDITTGVKVFTVEDSLIPLSLFSGSHTVNNKNELIYIDNDNNINKLSIDLNTTTTFIREPYSPWESQCLYCSPLTGDLLVGMYRINTKRGIRTGEVRRYNNTGKLTQTIPHNNAPRTLFRDPIYITENNNRDIVVSDWYCGIVVTDLEGRHRFSYTGPPSGSGLDLRAICTDALSHILVCDAKTDTVQMISKDGEFLSYLLKWEFLSGPWSLSYDVNTHLLLVGSGYNNTVSVYRYLNRHLDS